MLFLLLDLIGITETGDRGVSAKRSSSLWAAVAPLAPCAPCRRAAVLRLDAGPPLPRVDKSTMPPPPASLSPPSSLPRGNPNPRRSPLSAAHAVTVDAPCRHLRPPGAELMPPSHPPRRAALPRRRNWPGDAAVAVAVPFLSLRPLLRRAPIRRRRPSPRLAVPSNAILVSSWCSCTSSPPPPRYVPHPPPSTAARRRNHGCRPRSGDLMVHSSAPLGSPLPPLAPGATARIQFLFNPTDS